MSTYKDVFSEFDFRVDCMTYITELFYGLIRDILILFCGTPEPYIINFRNINSNPKGIRKRTFSKRSVIMDTFNAELSDVPFVQVECC